MLVTLMSLKLQKVGWCDEKKANVLGTPHC